MSQKNLKRLAYKGGTIQAKLLEYLFSSSLSRVIETSHSAILRWAEDRK